MFNMQNWTKKFFEQARSPMSKDVANIFFKMLMSDSNNSFDVTPIKGQFLYQVIESRAEHIGLKLSDATKVFLMFLTQSPGTAVMYLYALRSKTQSVTMQDIAEYFPMGFLSEEQVETLWDKQKGFNCDEKVDNCLDVYSFN